MEDKNNEIDINGKGIDEKNIILYEPPGTGKTYNTMNYAVAIIDKKKIEDLQKII